MIKCHMALLLTRQSVLNQRDFVSGLLGEAWLARPGCHLACDWAAHPAGADASTAAREQISKSGTWPSSWNHLLCLLLPSAVSSLGSAERTVSARGKNIYIKKISIWNWATQTGEARHRIWKPDRPEKPQCFSRVGIYSHLVGAGRLMLGVMCEPRSA